MSKRTSNLTRNVVSPRPGASKRPHVLDPIPTVEEAKRRLAVAGRPRPWLTPEGPAVFADAPTEI